MSDSSQWGLFAVALATLIVNTVNSLTSRAQIAALIQTFNSQAGSQTTQARAAVQAANVAKEAVELQKHRSNANG